MLSKLLGACGSLPSIPVLRNLGSRSISVANDLTTAQLAALLAGDHYFFLEQSEPSGHKHA